MRTWKRIRLVSGVVSLALATLATPAAVAAPPEPPSAAATDPASQVRAAAAPSRAVLDAAREAALASRPSTAIPDPSDAVPAAAPRSVSARLRAAPKSCGALGTIGLLAAATAACARLNSCPNGVHVAPDAACRIDRWI